MGPSIGGILTDPQERFPSTLGKIPLLQTHPYLLPCAVVAFLSLAFFFVALIGLKETHHVRKRSAKKAKFTKSYAEKRICGFGFLKKHMGTSAEAQAQDHACLNSDPLSRNYGTIHEAAQSTSTLASSASSTLTLDPDVESEPETIIGSDSESDSESYIEPPSTLKSILVPEVLYPVGTYSIIALLDSSYTVLIPLTYTTSVAAGGLGLSPFHVGIILSVWGAANMPFPIFCVPRLIKRFGARTINFIGVSSFLVGFGSLAGLSILAKEAGYANWLVWALIPVQFLLANSVGSMAYATAQLFVVNGAPSKSALGATNGLCQASKTFARTIGPVFATSLFSLSKENNICGGYMVYLVFILITLLCMRTTMCLPKELKRL
jgi:hypothetical protein